MADTPTMEKRMGKLMAAGAVLIILGVLGFAVPYFTTEHTKDVARIGDLKIQANEKEGHAIPQWAAGAVLGLGVVLLGAGLAKNSN